MNINLLAFGDGLVVLSVGFFVVFLFLAIMIAAMHVMGYVISYLNKIFPEAVAVPVPVKSSSADEEIAVAIACALMKQNY